MKKNLPFTILLIFLMAMNVGLLLLIFRKDNQEKRPPRQMMIEVLNLNSEQEELLLVLDKDHRQKMQNIVQKQNQARKELFKTIGEQQLSKEDKDSILLVIAKYEVQKSEEIFRFFSEIEQFSTPEQVRKLKKIIRRPGQENRPSPPPR